MAHRFKLDADLVARIAYLASDLSAEAEQHQAAFDERSERWQDGETGTAVGAWIESIGELADALESFEEAPDA